MSKIVKYFSGVFKDKGKAKSRSSSSASSASSNSHGRQTSSSRTSADLDLDTRIEAQTLSSLVKEVEDSVATIKKYLKSNGLPEPSLKNGDATVLPHAIEIRHARKTLNEALLALRTLNQYDNFEYVKEVAYGYTDSVSFKVVARFKVADVLDPTGEAMHISDICKKSGCGDGPKLLAALRVLTQHYIFKETKEQFFAHTKFSLELRDPAKRDLMSFDHVYDAGAAYYDAMVKWPASKDPRETPFQLGLKTDETFFEHLHTNPEEMTRFGSAMQGVSVSALKILQTVYPWNNLGEVTVVDVGCGRGHVTLEISKVAPRLKFVLQDVPAVITEAEELFDKDYKSRFEFEAYDFWTPQPRKAEVYFLRMILHDYDDENCIKILKNLVINLKPGKHGSGGRILIADTVHRPAASRPPTDLSVTQINMGLLALLNATDRTYNGLVKLFLAVDPRFKLRKWGDGGPQASEIVEAWLEE